MATHTVTAFAGLVQSEAIAIKFKTLGFFAIAKYFFIGIGLFGLLVVHAFLWVFVANFNIFFESVEWILRKLAAWLLLDIGRLGFLRWRLKDGAVRSGLLVVFAWDGAGIVLLIFITLEDNLIHDHGGLVLGGHESRMLFDDWSVDLLYFAGIAVVGAIDVVVGIV